MMSDQEIKELLEMEDMEGQRKICSWYCDIVADYKTSDEMGYKRVTFFKLNDYINFGVAMLNGEVIKTFKV